MNNPLMRHPLWTLHDLKERVYSSIDITSPEAHIERAEHLEARRVRVGATSLGSIVVVAATEVILGVDPDVIEWSTFGTGLLAGGRVFGNFQWAAYHRAKAEQLRERQPSS